MSIKLDTTSGDPLATFLIIKWKWSPIKSSVIVYLVAIVSSLIIAIATKTLQPSGKVENALFQDYMYWITESIVVPMAWGYYIWIFNAPEELLKKLKSNKVVNITDEKIEKSNLLFSNPIFVWLSVVGGILFGSMYYKQWVGTSTFWYSISSFFLAVRCVIVIGPLGYVITSLVIRFILNLIVLNNLLDDIKLQPLHPDRVGGVQPLGQYALKSVFVWAVGGCVAAGFFFWQNITRPTSEPILIYTAAILYCILSPILFLAPAISTHRSMVSAKYRLLREISVEYGKEQDNTLDEMHKNPTNLDNHIDKMKQLKQLHSLILEYPEWPYNAKTIRDFILLMSSPIFTIVMDIVITLAKNSISELKIPLPIP